MKMASKNASGIQVTSFYFQQLLNSPSPTPHPIGSILIINQPDAGEEERSVPPLQKYESKGLFHVHTWIFSWSTYTKV